MWKKWLSSTPKSNKTAAKADLGNVRILKHAQAMRVIFFYPGEEGTYVDSATVTLFENGVVHIRAKSEETTTHIQHCEILWKYEAVDPKKTDDKSSLRVIPFRARENNSSPPVPPT